MQKSHASNEMATAVLAATFLLLPTASRAQSGGPPQTVLRLTLQRAVEIALAPDGNYQLQLAQESVREARAHWGESRAGLLPSLDGSVTGQNQTLNLQAIGLRFNLPISGFTFPQSVGPFSTFDARLRATDNLLDIGILRRSRASKEGIHAAEGMAERSKDEVASAVAKSFLAAVRADSLVKVAGANVHLAEELLEIANHRESAGTGTQLDVTRARAQLFDERQRQVAAEVRMVRARLELLNVMHVSLDSSVELTGDSFPEESADANLSDAIAAGLKSRADLGAQRNREHGARLTDGAVRSEAFPSVIAFADYGALGVGVDQSVATHTLGISLRIPVFDGGRRQAARAASLSGLRGEEIRSRDLRDRIELEVREAFESLRSSREQLKLVEEGAQLAQDELAQARRRYEAGVISNLELVEAQRGTARAEEKRIEAMFSFRRALLDLWLATGDIRTRIQ